MVANNSNELGVQAPGGYWSEARRPLTSLFLAAPLLVIYELGLLFLGPDAVRNGAEALLRYFLDRLGFSVYFLLPGLTIAILLAWHHLLRQPWRVSHKVLVGMVFECVALAVGLWFVWQLQDMLLQSIRTDITNSIASTSPAADATDFRFHLGKFAGFCGAGVYEELLFRLILLSGVIGLLRWLHLSPRQSIAGGIALTSVLFSAAHYVGPWRDPQFDLVTFSFRCLAGAYFALLFRYRGFGIAAGAHAGYDVLVGMWR